MKDSLNNEIWRKAYNLHIKGKYKEAIKYYDLFLKESPDDLHVLANKGAALNGLKQYKKALIYHDKVLSVDPKNINALLHKATSLIYLKKYKEAIDCLDYSLKLDPNYFQAMNNKGNVYFDQRNYKLALKWYDKALNLKPEDTITLKNKNLAIKSLSNIDGLNYYLKSADKYNKKYNLKLEGFWTYNNEYFSWKFLAFLIKNKYVYLNEEMGKEIADIDLGDYSCLQEIFKDFQSAPWYYIGQGNIFNNEKDNYKAFKKTKKILTLTKNKKIYFPREDWWGFWFLDILKIVGKEYHEKTFKTYELHNLREFIKKEKIKGAIISYITSDEKCPIEGMDLGPLLLQFSSKSLKYLKLIFVEKQEITSYEIMDGKRFPNYKRYYDNKVEWVLAYSK